MKKNIFKYIVGDTVHFETTTSRSHTGTVLYIGYSNFLNDNLYVIQTHYGNIIRLTEKEIDYRSEK